MVLGVAVAVGNCSPNMKVAVRAAEDTTPAAGAGKTAMAEHYIGTAEVAVGAVRGRKAAVQDWIHMTSCWNCRANPGMHMDPWQGQRPDRTAEPETEVGAEVGAGKGSLHAAMAAMGNLEQKVRTTKDFGKEAGEEGQSW